ncbi:MAG: PorV/PorQ family protein [Candidatus Poribacteria bacterium]|nr:PorV/PorQ family protein [Candidatus Poribacteria bacterium]
MDRRLRVWLVGAVLTVACVGSSFAAAGRTGGLILDLPHRSVRAAGLADTFATADNDVNTALWNPAGLSTLDQTRILSGYTSFAEVFGDAGDGLYYMLASGATPIEGVGVIGATLQLNGKGSIDITTDSPEIIATESLGTDWVLSLSYAEQIAENLRLGLTGKVIKLKLGTGFEQASSATAYALDGGAQYDFKLGVPMTVGASLLNLGTRVQFKDENQSDPLPRKFHSGLAATVVDVPNTKLVLSVETVAAVDKMSQNRDDIDFVETVDERLADPDYEGLSREEVENGLMKDRGVGIHAFGWKRMERSFAAEVFIAEILAVRAGVKWFDAISESPNIDFMDRTTFGFGVDLSSFGLPFVIDYANGMWGPGGPNLQRVNSFSLSAGF